MTYTDLRKWAENRKGSLKIFIKCVEKAELASLESLSRARFATKAKRLAQASRLDIAVAGNDNPCSASTVTPSGRDESAMG
jgi:hypothetical protein